MCEVRQCSVLQGTGVHVFAHTQRENKPQNPCARIPFEKATQHEWGQHTLKQRYFSFEEVQYAFNGLMIH